MIYSICIDWLAVFCLWEKPHTDAPWTGDRPSWVPVEGDSSGELGSVYDWKFKRLPYGSRQFSEIWSVSVPNAEGGRDEFAEVQCKPYSKILHHDAIIVRFVNRVLYAPDFWELADMFLRQQSFAFKSISRIDICADFNQFATIDPRSLIEGFAAKKYRHVGRGVGALYFEHGVMHDKLTGDSDYGVKYNGLSFGTHSSDVRVYLYNKSFELATQGDKPWIRDVWHRLGLDVHHVWRLEVSIKGKGCEFKCKQSGKVVKIDDDVARDTDELAKIYHTFVARLFAFVKNRPHITNITREPRLQLFDGHFHYIRGVMRNKSASSRTEKMLLKALYQLGDKYRGGDIRSMGLEGQAFAFALADSCDLSQWLAERVEEWEKPIHK